MTRPTLLLTVGLPGCGKTTAARRFEVEQYALRLTKDEWVKALYGAENPASATDVIEGRLIALALRTVQLGVSVVLDFGLWSRDERTALRDAGAQAGAAVTLWYAATTPEEQRRRHGVRLAAEPESTWPLSDDEFASFASSFEVPSPGELDGSEPLDAPPTGYASWTAWMAHRWPARV